ncbi:MAG: SGNH/GDSL hydrolase family protein, partial [Kiloniellales bacterium]
QVTNLAVPGHTVEDALTTRPDFSFDDLTDLVLGLPGVFSRISRSQVEWAENSSPFIAGPPPTILVWLGPNDALVAATEADVSFLTPSDAFKDAYEEMMDRLAATGAEIVVANVPDTTVIPFLTPAEDLAAAFGIPTGLLRPTLGIGPGDFVTPDAFSVIEDILNMEASPPLPADVVLDAGEVARLRAATKAFNKFIAKQAEEHGAALFDVHGFLNRIDAEGTVVDGATLTTDFLGGLFSLDGVHPTNTGYALLANEFIEVMNAHFGAAIPPLSDDELAAILADDPLVFAAPAPVTTAVESMPTATADAIRAVLLGR